MNNLITNVNVQEEYKKAKNHLKKSYIALAEKEAEIPNKKNLENLEPCIRSLKLKSGAIIESVIIESTPIKTSYIEGEIVDLTGLKVIAVYSNGATRDVTDEVKCTPKNGDAIKMTDTNFLVEFEEGNVTLNEKISVKVAEYVPILQSIEVNDPPKKTIYLVGNSLDLNGMVITATYGRGEKVNVTNKCIFTPSNNTKLNLTDNKITISYSENGITKTTQIAISVETSTRTLVGIELQSQPTKLAYYTGEYFNPEGLTVIATFVGGETQNVTEYCSFEPSYIESADTTQVVVSYSENEIVATQNIPITVTESVIENIEIVELPKTDYFVGQSFDPTGMKVVANYNSGKQVDITSDCTISKTGQLTIDDEVITISYLDFTAEIDITVSKVEMTSIIVTKLPNKVNYYEGETVDITGIEIMAIFSNNSSMVLTGGFTYSPEVLSIKDSSVTITYQGLTTKYSVTVLEPVITKIEITTPPSKTTYFKDDLIDLTGMVVTGTYTDGTTENITSQCAYTPTGALTMNDTAITVRYNGFTTSTPITVTNFAPVSISIESLPEKTQYLVGDSLDLTGLVAKVTFNDSTSTQLLNGEGVTATPNGTLTANDTTITVLYTLNGITVITSFDITVIVADSVLENNSWETIKAISESGSASSVWNVGDTKNITIENKTYQFRIIGFNHDELVTPLANGQTKAGITFEMVDVYVDPIGIGTVDFSDSYINKTKIPEILTTLDSQLKNAIKKVKKIINTSNNFTLKTYEADMFIVSSKELSTRTTVDTYTIPNDGTIYDYYKSGNSIKKSKNYWTRTFVQKSGGYCYNIYVDSANGLKSANYNNGYYVSFAFCI